jgi:hypothetical protein
LAPVNEERYQGGLASEVEVEQARTILETTRAQLVDLGVARAQYEHAAAVLLGKPPADFSLPPLPLTTPPPPIPVGVQSELLERRPDIAGAERRVASANAQIGLAKTAYYPLVNIIGSAGFESGTITTLLQGPSALWSVGASAAATIFDGGRRHALNDEAKANGVSYDVSIETLAELKRERKTRMVAPSNVTQKHIERARRIVPIVSVQNRYSFADREWDYVVDYCERNAIVFIPWLPLGAGRIASEVLNQVAQGTTGLEPAAPCVQAF